tara:strand:- start:16 stop:804 length:789 start_codon:yes stop_codon:yes gene_type:complete
MPKIPRELKAFEEKTPRTFYRVVTKGFDYPENILTGYGYKKDPPDFKWNNHYGKDTAYVSGERTGAHFFAAEMDANHKTDDKGYSLLTLRSNGQPYVDIFKHKDNEKFRKALTANTQKSHDDRGHIRKVVDSYLDNLASNNKEVIISAPNNLKTKNTIITAHHIYSPEPKRESLEREHVGEFKASLGRARESLLQWRIDKIPVPVVDRKTKPKPKATDIPVPVIDRKIKPKPKATDMPKPKGPAVPVKTKKGLPAKKVEVKK